LLRGKGKEEERISSLVQQPNQEEKGVEFNLGNLTKYCPLPQFRITFLSLGPAPGTGLTGKLQFLCSQSNFEENYELMIYIIPFKPFILHKRRERERERERRLMIFFHLLFPCVRKLKIAFYFISFYSILSFSSLFSLVLNHLRQF